MMPRNCQITLISFLILLFLSACAVDDRSNNENFLANGVIQPTPPPVPEEFSGLQNPLENDSQAASEGEIIYQINCASCHGVTGRGDGVVAGSFEPRPTDLTVNQENLSDAYLYWRIYAGGAFEPFRSVMPGWRSLLTEEQIWMIITFIRTLEG